MIGVAIIIIIIIGCVCIIVIGCWQSKADHLLLLHGCRCRCRCQRRLLTKQIIIIVGIVANVVVIIIVGNDATISTIRYPIVRYLSHVRMLMMRSSAGHRQRITIIVICTIA